MKGIFGSNCCYLVFSSSLSSSAILLDTYCTPSRHVDKIPVYKKGERMSWSRSLKVYSVIIMQTKLTCGLLSSPPSSVSGISCTSSVFSGILTEHWMSWSTKAVTICIDKSPLSLKITHKTVTASAKHILPLTIFWYFKILAHCTHLDVTFNFL